MNELINTILTGGVGVALIGLMGQIISKLMDGNNKETPNIIEKISLFESNSETQMIIDRVVAKTNCERFLILKVENGGGKPRVGANLYASVIFESLKKPFISVKSEYQRLLVDPMYVKMLSDIGLTQHNPLHVNKMKSGILKRLYQSEGVKYSEIHYIGETDTSFYFASIATSKDDCEFSDLNDRVEIEISINKIRNIFNIKP